MGKKKNILGYYIIGSAIIWGLTGIAMSFQLKGTECFNEIGPIFGAAAGIHLILIWCPLAAQLKKQQGDKEADKKKK